MEGKGIASHCPHLLNMRLYKLNELPMRLTQVEGSLDSCLRRNDRQDRASDRQDGAYDRQDRAGDRQDRAGQVTDRTGQGR